MTDRHAPAAVARRHGAAHRWSLNGEAGLSMPWLGVNYQPVVSAVAFSTSLSCEKGKRGKMCKKEEKKDQIIKMAP